MTDSSRDRRGTNRGGRDSGGRSGGRDGGGRDAGRGVPRSGAPRSAGPRGGGRDRDRDRDRNTRGTVRPDEPAIPDDVSAADLDPEVRRDLLSLDKTNAEKVARHLIMVMNLLGEDPVAALAHARAARDRAGRVGVVRETAGIAAYTAGEWQEALGELRTARRLTGSNALLPLIADSERGLGRPERAIDLARSAEGRALTGDDATEMLIVESGARLDLGEPAKAVVTLQAANLAPGQTGDAAARLFYAYATALLAAGREQDATTWFMNAASADIDDVTDAEDRLMELSGASEPDLIIESDSVPEQTRRPEVAPEPVGEAPEPTATPVAPPEAEAVTEVERVAPDAPELVIDVKPAVVPDSEAVAVRTPEVTATPAPVAEPEAVEPEAEAVSAPTPTASSTPTPATEPESEGVAAPPLEATSMRAATLAAEYDVLLLDLDGTVFAGSAALPGAIEALSAVDVPQFYVTNNASRRAPEVAVHLTDLGFDASPEQVVTSAQAGARLLAQQLPPGSRALVVGTDGLAQEVREVGIGVTRSADDRPAAVIQGHSTTTDWAILSEAVLAINNGALWVACNVDATLPSERGFLIGNGSMVAAVANATGAEPLVAGKPAAPLMADAIERSASSHPLVVGDRLDTDIQGAVAVGVDSVLVLTGVSGVVDLVTATPEQRPTYVVDDLRGLLGVTDVARIGAQPGWSVSVSVHDDAVTIDVAAQSDAVDAALVPAVAAAAWEAIDAQPAVDAPRTVTVSASDERVRSLLSAVGVR